MYADIIIKNGRCVTMCGDGGADWVAAAGKMICAAGRGDDWQKLVRPGTQVIDARGGTVLPGFIDNHFHVMQTAVNMMSVDLGGARSHRELGEMLAAAEKREGAVLGCQVEDDPKSSFIEFSAQTRMSGVDLPDGTKIRKGASDAIEQYVTAMGGKVPSDLHAQVDKIASLGGTPLTVCEGSRILGVIYLKDTVKPGMVERFARLRAIGIKTIMCTGDNPLTAATIAKEAGVDGFIAECKPEDKIDVIKKEQAEGKVVAMTGDGTNDAPALAQANVGLAMNSGTTAAKEAANMVDLDSDPTKILEVVEIGKQLLITRGSLTTFSIANDVAKYFAIIPAMFMMAIPQLGVLNIMNLSTTYSAILSALIFNAIIIPCLIPLALKGVKYRPMSSGKILARNMMIYGIGGIITPFIGIKIIDLLITPLLSVIGL